VVAPDGVLVLTLGDGQATHIPLLAKGGELRLAFGDPSRHGAVWAIVATRNGDVYVMERQTGGYVKVSLHASGDWRYAWVTNGENTADLVKDIIADTGTRILDQWRPPPSVGGTLTAGLHIWTHARDVTTADPATLGGKDILWIKAPQAGEIAVFTVALLHPTGREMTFRGYLPLAGFLMSTGDTALIMASKREARPDEVLLRTTWQGELDKMRAALVQSSSYKPGATYRAAILTADEQGTRHLTDLAM
jgi:hypothetical protein